VLLVFPVLGRGGNHADYLEVQGFDLLIVIKVIGLLADTGDALVITSS
jgi:hypothetical protein